MSFWQGKNSASGLPAAEFLPVRAGWGLADFRADREILLTREIIDHKRLKILKKPNSASLSIVIYLAIQR
jgi:hypothetical protein